MNILCYILNQQTLIVHRCSSRRVQESYREGCSRRQQCCPLHRRQHTEAGGDRRWSGHQERRAGGWQQAEGRWQIPQPEARKRKIFLLSFFVDVDSKNIYYIMSGSSEKMCCFYKFIFAYYISLKIYYNYKEYNYKKVSPTTSVVYKFIIVIKFIKKC